MFLVLLLFVWNFDAFCEDDMWESCMDEFGVFHSVVWYQIWLSTKDQFFCRG